LEDDSWNLSVPDHHHADFAAAVFEIGEDAKNLHMPSVRDTCYSQRSEDFVPKGADGSSSVPPNGTHKGFARKVGY
jgi:hypothetical protein